MTREEALKILDSIPTISEQVEALELAINALEQESSGDLISREETLTAFADYVGSGMSMNDFDALWNIVTKLPSVKQTGHWIAVTNGRGGHECSLCHEYAPSYQSGDEWLTKYCPNCGAKMESEG